MSKSERFKFGEINLPKDSLPSPDGVYEAIEAIDNCERSRKRNNVSTATGGSVDSHESTAAYLGNDHDEYSYCHFQYRIRTDSDTVLTTDATEKNERRFKDEGSRVFYFENGQFAVTTTQNMTERRVPEYIGAVTNTDVRNSYELYEATHGVAERGERAYSATIESTSEVPTDRFSRSGSGLQAPMKPAENAEPTVISSDRQTDVVDETAERLLDTASGCAHSGFASGTVVVTWSETDWPDDTATEKRAETIRKKIVPQLRKHV